jgi:hypothetical protein
MARRIEKASIRRLFSDYLVETGVVKLEASSSSAILSILAFKIDAWVSINVITTRESAKKIQIPKSSLPPREFIKFINEAEIEFVTMSPMFIVFQGNPCEQTLPKEWAAFNNENEFIC